MMKVLSSRPIRCKTINSSGSTFSTPWNCRESEGCRVLQTSVDKTITLFVFFYWSWKIDVFHCEKKQGTSWPSYLYLPTFWIAILHLNHFFGKNAAFRHKWMTSLSTFIIPKRMYRKVPENMKFIPFVKNDFETKVENETIHNLGIADQKIFSNWIFYPFL